MSRRKQTNPNKVHWEQVLAGLEKKARQAMMNTDIVKEESSEMGQQDRSSSESDAEDTTIDDLSSPGSEEDQTERESENDPGVSRIGKKRAGETASAAGDGQLDAGLFACPLCQMDCESQEQLVTHVYQHTAAVVSAKSYLCPVCGRALSSPGSLGRHLLIHSQDQLSNCAVCGAQFSSHATFNSEKLPEVLTPETWNQNNHKASNSEDEKCLDFDAVYPAGILLVCNNCVEYRKMIAAQVPAGRKWAARRTNEPVEARMQRLERERTAKKSRRDSETPEERELRRMRDREAKRQQRMQETDEQRSRRLQRDREAMRLKRANETPEKRQARLVREREAKRLKRRLEKMDMMLRAQFGQDPTAMAALAAEMNFFQLPVGNSELDQQLLGKMPLEDQSNGALH
ncbi:zinc finger protein 821 isoform X2 [Spea bombifrons]|uniref:zinc finger protein 821 isoform X2 n=1 Tax=Spea bombifrons TaxID=233779 RepID=UPI0023493258|nr:zinc finger protein 821 isoform X2 [Spea bombifrons]